MHFIRVIGDNQATLNGWPDRKQESTPTYKPISLARYFPDEFTRVSHQFEIVQEASVVLVGVLMALWYRSANR